MEPATTLAIIILIIAILILLYYYLQSTNNQVYQNIHAQASGISGRVAQEEYIVNLSEKVNNFSDKFKDRVQDDEDEDHISKTDAMSKKITQFIDEQSEQVIADWNLATNNDLDQIIERYEALNNDFSSYKESNDSRVSELEQRVDKISEELSALKD